MSKGIFYGVSVGPGDPELMTVKAVKTLEKSDVIFSPETTGGKTVALDIAGKVADLSQAKVVTMVTPMEKGGRERVLEAYRKGAEEIIEYLSQGKNVSLVNLGDISIYSTFGYIYPQIKEAGFEVEIIAGVPSFCAAAAAFQVSLTEIDKPLHIIPANYGDTKTNLAYPGTKVLMKAGKVLDEIREELSQKEHAYALLAENCGLPNEKLKRLDESDEHQSYFTTLIIKD